jgi:hypothetical protein
LVAEQQLQGQMVDALIAKADLTRQALADNPARWRDVTDAGLVEVDLLCDRYLAALFTFNREQRAGRQILTAAGAGTAAILGLTGAAGATVALVAASFGIAANVFDAGANSVLFTVSPTAVRAVAVRGRQAYLETIKWERVNSRPRMMMVVQGYLAQCTPAAIEANIDNAATGAPSVSNIGTALQAAALAAPSASVVQDPAVFIASPVTGPAKPPPIPTVDQPLNPTKIEATLIRTKGEAAILQRALGTSPDGNLGPAGLLAPGPTRLAIREYNTGLLRAGGKTGPASDVMDGDLTAYSTLIARNTALGATSVKSPFERALLGDQPSCKAIRDIIDAVKGPPITETAPKQCMDILRKAIDARRQALAMPEPAGVLDSKLYDKREVEGTIVDPPAKPK